MAMKQNAKRKQRQCLSCWTMFQPKGNAAKFCKDCAEFRQAVSRRNDSRNQTLRRGGTPGVGSGGMNEGDCHDQKYRQWYLMDVYREQQGQCAECWVDLSPQTMLLHHKDHDRKNNSRHNFAGVCKRCHQIEHQCWEAFKKV